MTKRKESELYEPVKRLFADRGFTVRAEVLDCDLVAMPAEESGPPHIVELKANLNLTVFLQAMARQSITPFVYIAVPETSGRRGHKKTHWRELLKLCEIAGVGLMTVTFLHERTFVTEHVLPTNSGQRRLNEKKRAAIVREHRARVGDYNVGGSTRVKRMTAYRQLALLCAKTMAGCEFATPAFVRAQLGNDAKIAAILRDNVYGWFERIERGQYRLTESGQAALLEYADVLRQMS